MALTTTGNNAMICYDPLHGTERNVPHTYIFIFFLAKIRSVVSFNIGFGMLFGMRGKRKIQAIFLSYCIQFCALFIATKSECVCVRV